MEEISGREVMKLGTKLKRWSLARCQNVKYINKLFSEDPERIEYLDDVNLVVMSKSNFIRLTNQANYETRLDSFLNRHFKVVENLIDMVNK